MRARSIGGVLAIAALCLSGRAAAQDAAPVARILAERCVMCHQGEAAPLGLRLDSLEGLLAGSRNGPVVKAGDPAASELVRRLRGERQPRMPLTGPPFLSEAEIASVEKWISAGAPRAAATALAKPRTRKPGEPLTYADVQPILGARCAKCHADNGRMGAPPEGFRLNNYANTVASEDRARLVPGRPAASELVRRIRGQSLPRMPFDGPPYLDDEEIKRIERWITDGARDADGRPAPVPAGARVRLGGTYLGGTRLDELEFEWRGRARRRATPGGTAELRGIVGEDGRVLADRLRAR